MPPQALRCNLRAVTAVITAVLCVPVRTGTHVHYQSWPMQSCPVMLEQACCFLDVTPTIITLRHWQAQISISTPTMSKDKDQDEHEDTHADNDDDKRTSETIWLKLSLWTHVNESERLQSHPNNSEYIKVLPTTILSIRKSRNTQQNNLAQVMTGKKIQRTITHLFK